MYVIFPSRAARGSQVGLKTTAEVCMSRNVKTQQRPLPSFSCWVSKGQWRKRSKQKERRWPSFVGETMECVGRRWQTENQRTGWKTGPYAHEQRLFLFRSHAFFFLGRFLTTKSEATPTRRAWWDKCNWQHGANSSNKVTIFSTNHNKLMAKMKYFIITCFCSDKSPTTFMCSSAHMQTAGQEGTLS